MSTSIDNLPNENKGTNNVVLKVKESNKDISQTSNAPVNSVVPMSAPTPAPNMLSQESINEIVRGIQTASQNNLTALPSRDIPMDTQHITNDNTVRPNYVPETNNDYIQEENDLQSLLVKNRNKEEHRDRLDNLYDELQNPLFAMLLFFLFQLPFVDKLMVKYIPSAFSKDGNSNLSGYIIKTIMYGLFFYSLSKTTKFISEI